MQNRFFSGTIYKGKHGPRVGITFSPTADLSAAELAALIRHLQVLQNQIAPRPARTEFNPDDTTQES